MILTVRHRTIYRYDTPPAQAALRLKMFPAQTASQTPRSWSVAVNGQATSARITNGYGDDEAIWISREGTSAIEVVAAGEVETRDVHGVLRGWRMAARPAMFLRRTPLTAPSEEIHDLAARAMEGKSGIAAAHALSDAVRDAVEYRPGVTNAKTTAAEAVNLGAGVCQDHTHVLIAAARSIGAAARYVVGYLFVDDKEGGELSTETETHAWAELWVDGLGWVGFDAANRICPTDHYIRLASGLDAVDAAPLRGAIAGSFNETLEAEVQVSQSQQ